MKKWRVGTLSMGITLIMLGISLLFSLSKGSDAVLDMLNWWPVVLVLLGAELLVHMSLSRKDDPPLRYDIFSILFVGLLCAGGLLFAALSSTGIMAEVKSAVGGMEQSVTLPELRQPIPAGVKAIAVHSGNSQLQIKQGDANEVYLFGTYRQHRVEGQSAIDITQEDFIAITRSGSTLYIDVKEPPQSSGVYKPYETAPVTLVVPASIPVEIAGIYNNNELPEQLP